MIEVKDLTVSEAREWLGKLNYAHLACCCGDDPYVVPVHYAFDGENVFVYTTEGKKAEIMRANPKVCLQAEQVEDNENWTSVIAEGEAEMIENERQRLEALDLILKTNPKLTPALSVRWMDSWVRQNVEVIFSIRPRKVTGRQTVNNDRTKRPLRQVGEPGGMMP